MEPNDDNADDDERWSPTPKRYRTRNRSQSSSPDIPPLSDDDDDDDKNTNSKGKQHLEVSTSVTTTSTTVINEKKTVRALPASLHPPTVVIAHIMSYVDPSMLTGHNNILRVNRQWLSASSIARVTCCYTNSSDCIYLNIAISKLFRQYPNIIGLDGIPCDDMSVRSYMEDSRHIIPFHQLHTIGLVDVDGNGSLLQYIIDRIITPASRHHLTSLTISWAHYPHYMYQQLITRQLLSQLSASPTSPQPPRLIKYQGELPVPCGGPLVTASPSPSTFAVAASTTKIGELALVTIAAWADSCAKISLKSAPNPSNVDSNVYVCNDYGYPYRCDLCHSSYVACPRYHIPSITMWLLHLARCSCGHQYCASCGTHCATCDNITSRQTVKCNTCIPFQCKVCQHSSLCSSCAQRDHLECYRCRIIAGRKLLAVVKSKFC
jgi:hypothetical protein